MRLNGELPQKSELYGEEIKGKKEIGYVGSNGPLMMKVVTRHPITAAEKEGVREGQRRVRVRPFIRAFSVGGGEQLDYECDHELVDNRPLVRHRS